MEVLAAADRIKAALLLPPALELLGKAMVAEQGSPTI